MLVSQQESNWLEMRRNKIGASDAPIIMDVSPWKTPYQLWEEKLKLRPDQAENSAMRRGKQLEKAALREFESITGIMMIEQMVSVHPIRQWMMATLDGIDLDQKNIVEIKCAGREDHQMALDGEVPKKYVPQLQHQLEVTGLEKAYYFSFDGKQGKVLEIYRDDTYIKKLLEREERFWECMQTLQAPKLCARDYVEKCDEVWVSAAEEWIRCQEELEALKAKEEDLRKQFISMSESRNCVGGGIKLSRVIRKGNVDYSAIPELQSVDLEAYRKAPIEMWRLSA